MQEVLFSVYVNARSEFTLDELREAVGRLYAVAPYPAVSDADVALSGVQQWESYQTSVYGIPRCVLRFLAVPSTKLCDVIRDALGLSGLACRVSVQSCT